MRTASTHRASEETDITVNVNVEGVGKAVVAVPSAFLKHMLEGFAKHGGFDLTITAKGDTHIDQHHTLEDLGMVLGSTFRKALGEKKGINRAGFFAFPMDEALGLVAIDLSGRPYLIFKADFKRQMIGDLESDSVREFFSGFSMGCGCNLTIIVPYGENDHHKLEALFKAFGKALQMACSTNERLKEYIPSTKGVLDSF